MALLDELKAAFPWIGEVGLSPSWFQEVAATSASSAEIVQQIRNTPQYKQRFPGLTRQDGTVRMSEAQYTQQEAAYRNLLTQYGYDTSTQYRTPSTLVGFFESEIDPNELQDRLEVYRQVQQGGQAVKDAFYVYAGLDVTDDDLFEAVVDPAAEQNLSNSYNQAVAAQAFDYGAFITRATERGLQRVVDELNRLKTRGVLTAEAVAKVQAVDPTFAREIMSAIYTGGQVGGMAGSLNLQELLDSFQFAAIGAAAQNAGLDLPTKERLAEIRAAGVEQARAISAYSEFGKRQGEIGAAVQRARGTVFGQSQFEAATFLNDAEQGRALDAGLAYLEASGKAQGSFRFDEENGRFVQRGFTNRVA